ncbi:MULTISPECIES: hypothetical protein [Acinetobacter]|uniref:hypothetical protein n=1 Tax=Acinetobacter TaxID=469 RepID=UPI001F4B7004|nr:MULTISPECIES: hypothetical protein [Acinetobacter]MCH7381599.1 hypothetical protein [Acinetobacter higginsii]
MKTLLLDQDTWDLVLDAEGNLASAAEPYAVAQDVASAVKLFESELWYDTSKGIPYFSQVLGYLPPPSLLYSYFKNAALSVPTVTTAKVVLNPMDDRTVTGQIQFTDTSGAKGSVNI